MMELRMPLLPWSVSGPWLNLALDFLFLCKELCVMIASKIKVFWGNCIVDLYHPKDHLQPDPSLCDGESYFSLSAVYIAQQRAVQIVVTASNRCRTYYDQVLPSFVIKILSKKDVVLQTLFSSLQNPPENIRPYYSYKTVFLSSGKTKLSKNNRRGSGSFGFYDLDYYPRGPSSSSSAVIAAIAANIALWLFCCMGGAYCSLWVLLPMAWRPRAQTREEKNTFPHEKNMRDNIGKSSS